MLAAGDLTPVGLKKLVSKMDVLTNIIYAVIARSGATRQSRSYRKSRLKPVEHIYKELEADDNDIPQSRPSGTTAGCSTSCGWHSKTCN